MTEPLLVVDLDECLIRVDVSVEAFKNYLRTYGWYRAPYLGVLLALKGRAFVKTKLAARVPLDPATLPYNEGFLTFLKEQAAAGRQMVLATGAPLAYAQRISEHLGFFSDVIATETTNTIAKEKLAKIRQRYPDTPFQYAGNSKADLSVWPAACGGILVTPDPGVAEAFAALEVPLIARFD